VSIPVFILISSLERKRRVGIGKGGNRGENTFVTAAMNVSSEMGSAVLFEKDSESVITSGVLGSRAACKEIRRLVSLTVRAFEAGGPSGKAEEKAHSSSSAAATAGAGAAGGCGLAKSKIDFCGCCWGVAFRIGDVRAAKGSTAGAGAAGLGAAAAICCC
jgi:hypothetical protein